MATKAKKAAPLVAGGGIEAVKGFNRDWTCREHQFAIGQSYTLDGAPVICERGFHAVEMPLDAFTYYAPGASLYATVTLGSDAVRHEQDSKIASASITVTAGIELPDVIRRAVAWVLERARGNTATGYSGHAAATGTGGHAAATGYRGHAAATGKHAIAAALGPDSTAKAGPDGWIVLTAWRWEAGGHELLHVRAARVGGPEGVEAGKTYCLNENGNFVLADIT